MSASARPMENTSEKICRLCRDPSNTKDLIIPCLCNGPLEYAHRQCLDNLRALNMGGHGSEYCETCQFKYVIKRVLVRKGITQTKTILFRLLVVFDVLGMIIISQGITIGFKYLFEYLDKTDRIVINMYPASMDPFLVYYISGLIMVLVLMGVFGRLTQFPKYNHDHGTKIADIPCAACVFYNMICCRNTNENSQSGLRGGGDPGEGCVIFIYLIGILILIAALGCLVIIDVFLGVIRTLVLLKELIFYHGIHAHLVKEEIENRVKNFRGKKHELRKIRKANRLYGSTPVTYIQPTHTTPEIHFTHPAYAVPLHNTS